MKISTRARYGARLMVNLGLNYSSGPVFLKDISEQEQISLKYLSQIIIPLKAAGLVNSFRGAHGGYALAKHPSEITMKNIVEVMEGNFNLADCLKDASECHRTSICVTRDVWNALELKMAQTLDEIKLDDLVKQCIEKKEKAVMYTI
ncbi:MAG: Rrf2 family transcriptional regulator [Candidatus Zapsychrus exili]|nr:Rrf2 family transcriptional regulator [Candidatus Zapsychrus exili]